MTDVTDPMGCAARHTIATLQAASTTVATCESLTGGMICAALTSVPGSSLVVRGALVTYATDLKTTVAGVPADLIRRCGVVSDQVALAMARGARRVCEAQWGVGVTGVAGPGPSEGVPEGTVWLAVVGPSRSWAMELTLPGDRSQVRSGVVVRACNALAHAVQDG